MYCSLDVEIEIQFSFKIIFIKTHADNSCYAIHNIIVKALNR